MPAGQSYHVQKAANARHACRAPKQAVDVEQFGDDVADQHAWIERGRGILKHDLRRVGAAGAFPRSLEGAQVGAAEHDPTGRRPHQHQAPQTRTRFAASALADDRQRAPRSSCETHQVARR